MVADWNVLFVKLRWAYLVGVFYEHREVTPYIVI